MAPSLLGLPPELRLWIYDLLLANRNIFLNDETDDPGIVRNVFALGQVCTTIRNEVLPLLPAISEITFETESAHACYVDQWLEAMGSERISHIRKIIIYGNAVCFLADDMGDVHCHQDDCCYEENLDRRCIVSADINFARGFEDGGTNATSHTSATASNTPTTQSDTSVPANWEILWALAITGCSNGSEECTKRFERAMNRGMGCIVWGGGEPQLTNENIKGLWAAVREARGIIWTPEMREDESGRERESSYNRFGCSSDW